MNPEKLTAAVYRVAIAFGILCLDINLGSINILPDWLGYGMILSALEALSEEEPSAALLRPLGYTLIGWSLAEWCAKLIGHTINGYGVVYLVVVVQLYFQFQLLTNMAAIAAKYVSQFEQKILRLRTVMTLMVTGYGLVSAFIVSEAVAIIVAVVQLGAAFWLWRTLLSMEEAMTEVFGLQPQGPQELTFAERIQMNMETAEE